MIAIAVLTLVPVSLVRAKDIGLKPFSGSDCDSTTFEYSGHTIAEGFAASISADLPVAEEPPESQIKFGCAVAGLGEPWEEFGVGYYLKFTPFVKEMAVRVEGDDHYNTYIGSICDNTGTGGSSCGLFEAVLYLLDFAFSAWEIYNWLAEIYQEPPDAEFQPKYPLHWVEAIARQQTEYGIPDRYVSPNNKRLQTATANVIGYFEEGCSGILNVTAEAEIYVQMFDVYNNIVAHFHVGTYQVSFLVSLEPVCAMKTRADGYFYVPNVATDLLKVELLFDDSGIEGDQAGGISPYDTIQSYPDGKVETADLSLIGSAWGTHEGETGWNYMADIVPNRHIGTQDLSRFGGNWGNIGTYITSLAGVTVTFDTGDTKSPDSYGYVTIPQDATSFTVKRYGNPIGAMIIFW